jgi:hypothetical protein
MDAGVVGSVDERGDLLGRLVEQSRDRCADDHPNGQPELPGGVRSENPRSPWWREQCALEPGRSFAVQAGRGRPAIGRARALSVQREPLGRLSQADARAEGFNSVEAFERAFTAINGVYDPAALVWRVHFEAMEDGR